MLRIHHFTILHQERPLGIDEAPYFSWKLESDRQNVLQSAFRLRVFEESGKTVWDSGRQETEQSTYVVYAGEPLQSRTIYTVHVTVWDNQGEQAEAETRFETAFMDKADWRSAWVKSPFPVGERGPHLGEQPEAVFFRREMQLKAAPVRARLYASCHGAYQLTLNGGRPDDRELAPEFTVYRSYLSYQVYDVTALLHEGTNVLGMLVGDGWYHGYMSRTVDEAYDPALAAIFQLELQYYILTVAALAKELEFRHITECEAVLAVGLPIQWIGAQKEAFRKYLMRNELIEFRYHEQDYLVRIDDVQIFPQGFAGVVQRLGDFKGLNVLADIGNGTMNTMLIKDGKPKLSRCFTDKLGVEQCIIRMSNELLAVSGHAVPYDVCEDFLRRGSADLPEKYTAVMQKAAEEYSESIIAKLREYEFNPEIMQLTVMGGGACILKHFWAGSNNRVRYIEDICATAKGYELLALNNLKRSAVEK